MTRIAIGPAEEGYSVTYPSQVHADALEGGASRYRRELLFARNRVEVQWYVDQAGYDYMMAFYRSATARGALPFTLDLFVDSAELTEYQAFIVPNTFALSGVLGDAHIVTATLEVPSLPWDPGLDEAILDEYESGHGYDDEFYSLLAQLVNDHLPGVA